MGRLKLPDKEISSIHKAEDIVKVADSYQSSLVRNFFPSNVLSVRDDFLSSSLSNPKFEYDLLLKDDFLKKATILKRARQDISSLNLSSNLKKVYLDYVDDRLLINSILLASQKLNKQASPKTVHAENFLQSNEACFGLPNEQLFEESASHLLWFVEQTDKAGLLPVGFSCELKDMLPPEVEASPLKHADEETLAHYNNLANQVAYPYKEALQEINREVYSPKSMRNVFELALEKTGLAKEGWKAYLVNNDKLTISPKTKRANIGRHRQPLLKQQLKALLMHEIGVHAMRAHKGSSISLILSANQHRASEFEEGLGVAMEQAICGHYENSREDRYLYIGLALGIDGKSRDFRQVFEYAWRIEALKLAAAGERWDEKLLSKARMSGYTATLRVYRGTPGNIPGLAFTKDLIYLRGCRRAWSYLDKISEDYSLFGDLFIAKYDPTKREHVRFIEDVGASAETPQAGKKG